MWLMEGCPRWTHDIIPKEMWKNSISLVRLLKTAEKVLEFWSQTNRCVRSSLCGQVRPPDRGQRHGSLQNRLLRQRRAVGEAVPPGTLPPHAAAAGRRGRTQNQHGAAVLERELQFVEVPLTFRLFKFRLKVSGDVEGQELGKSDV